MSSTPVTQDLFELEQVKGKRRLRDNLYIRIYSNPRIFKDNLDAVLVAAKNTEDEKTVKHSGKEQTLGNQDPFLPDKGLAPFSERILSMKCYLHWFPENVSKVKETIDEDGKNARTYLHQILEYENLQGKENKLFMRMTDLILDNEKTKKKEKALQGLQSEQNDT